MVLFAFGSNEKAKKPDWTSSLGVYMHLDCSLKAYRNQMLHGLFCVKKEKKRICRKESGLIWLRSAYAVSFGHPSGWQIGRLVRCAWPSCFFGGRFGFKAPWCYNTGVCVADVSLFFSFFLVGLRKEPSFPSFSFAMSWKPGYTAAWDT